MKVQYLLKSSMSLVVLFIFIGIGMQSKKLYAATPVNNIYKHSYIDKSVTISKWFSEPDNNIGDYKLFSHGRSGELFLNKQWLGAPQIVKFIKENKLINKYTTRLSIFGCEFAKGKKGLDAIKYLEKYLGISIAASTNITGFDGDWMLEYGNVDARELENSIVGNLQFDPNQDLDGDGILNFNDIDDDNDGILDRVEGCTYSMYATVGKKIRGTSTTVLSRSLSSKMTQDAAIGLLSGSFKDQYIGSGVFDFVTRDDVGVTDSFSITFSQAIPIDEIMVGVRKVSTTGASVTIGVSGGTATALDFNDTIVGENFVRAANVYARPSTATGDFNLNMKGVNKNTLTTITFKGAGFPAGTTADDHSYFVMIKNHVCDPDGDLIDNNLDLDSDGDVCPDAKEAGVVAYLRKFSGDTTSPSTSTYSPGIPVGTPNSVVGSKAPSEYGANGFYSYIESSNVRAATYKGRYIRRLRLNPALTNCPDYDNDGISDFDDIDDDNDGILDAVEAPTCYLSPAETDSLTEIVAGAHNNSLDNSGVLIDKNTTTATFAFTSGSTIAAGGMVFEFGTLTDTRIDTVIIDMGSTTGITSTATNTGKLQALSDNETWVDLSGNIAIGGSGTIPGGNIIFPVTTANAGNYNTYRIISNTAITLNAQTIAEVLVSRNDALYVKSANPREGVCADNKDGTGDSNDRDLDSDGDMCTDAKEGATYNRAGVTTIGDSVITNISSDNGFADVLQYSSDTNTYKYSYYRYTQYALSASMNACGDTDLDGIPDVIDIDDDNDGILDSFESPSCFYTEVEYNKPTAVSSTMAVTGLINLIDGSSSTTANYTAANIQNQTIIEITSSVPTALVDYIRFEMNTTASFLAATSKSIKVQGWTGTAWVDLTDSITPPAQSPASAGGFVSIFFTKNKDAYTKYRILGVSITATSLNTNAIREVTLRANLYVPSANPKPTCTGSDKDGDGFPDHLDLDTDGDGCPDAMEALTYNKSGVTTSASTITYTQGIPTNTPNSVLNGTYGVNGFADVLEAAWNVNAYKYVYYYKYDDPTINGCLDKDGDGGADFVDLDDDNDGVLDDVEMKLCPTAPANTTLTTSNNSFTTVSIIGSDSSVTPSTAGKTFWVGGGTFAQDESLVFDFSKAVTKVTITNVSSISGLTANFSELFEILINGTMYRLSPEMFTNFASHSSLTSDGAVGATTSSSANNFTTLTLTFPAGITRLEVRNNPFIASGQNGFEIESIIVNDTTAAGCTTSTLDTDGDGITNNLDLDSDADGCYDYIEASVGKVDSIAASPYGTNGFSDAFETSIESGRYKSIYTYNFAISAQNNACLDSDGDGISDVKDIDDDNDGVLDAVESPSCFYTQKELVRASTVISDFAYTTTNPLTNIYDTITGTRGVINGAVTNVSGKVLFDITLPVSLPQKLDSLIVSAGSSAVGSGAWTLQGKNIITGTWDTLSASQVFNSAINYVFKQTLKTTEVYNEFRLLGTSTNGVTNGGSYEIDLFLKNYVQSANPKLTCTVDTDGDGLLNHLDLNSDADACTDSYESGVTALTGSGMSTRDSIVPAPYNGNGFADRLQATADTNTYKGTYTYPNAINAAISSCPLHLCSDFTSGSIGDSMCAVIASGDTLFAKLDCDGDGATNGKECTDGTDPSNPCEFFVGDSASDPDTDGDGVPNSRDVDDDNDGILDIHEMRADAILKLTSETLRNDTAVDSIRFTINVPQTFTSVNGIRGLDVEITLKGSPHTDHRDITSTIFECGMAPSAGLAMGWDIKFVGEILPYHVTASSLNPLNGRHASPNIFGEAVKIDIGTFGTITNTLTELLTPNSPDTFHVTGSGTNTNEYVALVLPSATATTSSGNLKSTWEASTLSSGLATSLSYEYKYNQWTESNITTALIQPLRVNIKVLSPIDTDNDGIPDHLDLDSDNDGIPDAYEACGNTSLVLESCRLDSNGNATYLDTNGDGCIDGIVSGACGKPIDTDKDSIPDFRDQDSDNDGCPDATEASISRTAIVNKDITNTTYTAPNATPDGLTNAGCVIPNSKAWTDSTKEYGCATTPDTVTVRSGCPTCPVTACPVVNDVDTVGVTNYSTCTPSPVGYTVKLDSTTGCVTYTPNGMVMAAVKTCIITCDPSGRCDTTWVIIPPPITPDSVTVRPSCPTCPVKACVIADDIVVSSTTTYTSCGLTASDSTKGTMVLTPDGCLIWDGNGTAATDTIRTCLVACNGSVCDTTYVTILPAIPPYGPDTIIVSSPRVGTPLPPVCATGDDIPAGYMMPRLSYCGLSSADSMKGTLAKDINGCLVWTSNSLHVDTIKTCIVRCADTTISGKTSTVCDTTYAFYVAPPKADSSTVKPACATCEVSICPTADDITVTSATVFSNCGIPPGYTTVSGPTTTGCLTIKPDPSNIRKDTVKTCVVACNGNVCDTTYITIYPPLTPDTVITTASCPTCPVTACPVIDDVDTSGGGATYTSCGAPSGYTATLPDSKGCVTYTPNGMVKDTVKTCIITCNKGICDTTWVIMPPPPPTPDTVTARPDCPTCPVTVCAVVDDVDTTSVTNYSTCTPPPTGYTVVLDSTTGCVTYTPNGMVMAAVKTCIVTCDPSGRCDTTYVFIAPPPPTPDTVTVRSACPTCPVKACPVVDDVDTVGVTNYSTCAPPPTGYTASGPDAQGCVTYTPSGTPLTHTVKTCIVTCDPSGRCDTTWVFIAPPPTTPDTLRVMQRCDTCSVTACPAVNDVDTAGVTSYSTCDPPPTGYTVTDPDSKGCVTYTPNGPPPTDTVKTCIVTCDSSGRCDTTWVFIAPPPPTPDTVTRTPTCPTCPINVCAVVNDVDTVGVTNYRTCTPAPTGYTTVLDSTTGCVTYTPNGMVKDTVKTCIVTCNPSGRCDTTWVIMLPPPPTPDTVTARPDCPTCPVTVCAVVDDVDTTGVTNYSTCSPAPTGYTVELDSTTGCVTYTPNGMVMAAVKTCIVTCDPSGRCDTTYVFIAPPPPTPDTVTVRSGCPTCPVTACPVVNDVDTVGVTNYSTCTPSPVGYTVKLDSTTGCVTYTPNGMVMAAVKTCIITCDPSGRCDTTWVIIPPPITPDSVTVRPSCPTCPVKACVIADDIVVSSTTTYTSCGLTSSDSAKGTMVLTPDGCLIWDGNGTSATDTIRTCLVACNGSVCDTTYITILSAIPPYGPDTIIVSSPGVGTPLPPVCATGDDIPAGYMMPRLSYCGLSSADSMKGTLAKDINGCLVWTSNSLHVDTIKTCIVRCADTTISGKTSTVCDTTYAFYVAPPKADTSTVKPACATCEVSICPTADDITVTSATVFSTCGIPPGYTTVSGPTTTGCLTIKPDPSNIRRDTAKTCVVACNGNVCDTTYIIIYPPLTPDTVITTASCPTCPVTACPVIDDVDTSGGGATYTSCGAPSGYTATLPDSKGCVTYTPNGMVKDTVKTCIITCNKGICDTTWVIMPPPPPTPDTVTARPDCPTCPVTVCAVVDDVDTTGVTNYSTCTPPPTGYTVELDSTTGCVTYTPNGMVMAAVKTCIVTCDPSGRCDTTYVFIAPPPPTPDTVTVRSGCPTCPVTACPVVNDVDTVGVTNYSTCTPSPVGYTVKLDSTTGCVTYTPNGMVMAAVKTCIITCDPSGRCDTTWVIIPPPITPDSVTVRPSCPTCPVKACVIADDIVVSSTTTYTSCGLTASDSTKGTMVLTPDGCLIWDGNGTAATDTIRTCLVACNGSVCDTTYVTILPAIPPYGPDTIIVSSPRVGTPLPPVCATGDDIPAGYMMPRLSYCGLSSADSMKGTLAKDINGCLVWTSNSLHVDTIKTCIVRCADTTISGKTSTVCDTTYAFYVAPPKADSSTVKPACATCEVSICPTADDITVTSATVFSNCGIPPGYTTVSGPTTTGCLTIKPDPSNIRKDTVKTCVVACNGNVCDTTYITIYPPLTPDTVITTASCPTCPVTACPVIDDVDTSGGGATYTSCGAPSGYTATLPDSKGCVTYTPNGMVKDTVKTCIITCNKGICDTTWVIMPPPPPTPDTVTARPDCPTCPVTVCAVVDDVDTTSVTNYSTCTPPPTGYTVVLDSTTGCVTYTPNGMVMAAVKTCIVTCDPSGRCDTTYVFIAPPIKSDTTTQTFACSAASCPVSACPTADDVNVSQAGAMVEYKSCDATIPGYILTGPDLSGCVSYEIDQANPPTARDTTCLIACVNGVCDTTFVILDPVSILPVKIANVGVKWSSSNAIVSWTTFEEQSTSHYEIERSIDGGSFTSVGKQNALGNSNVINRHSFTDPNIKPRVSSTVSYRIVYYDIDGQKTYSEVVTLRVSSEEAINYVLYPNPNGGERINFNNLKDVKKIQIYDALGQIVRVYSKIDPSVKSYTLNRLAAGYYRVALYKADGKVETLNMVVQR